MTKSETTGELWLGYSGLSVDCAAISAVLLYQPAWDRRIVQAYGQLPAGVRSVVLLDDGRVLPARRPIEDIRHQLAVWHAEHVS